MLATLDLRQTSDSCLAIAEHDLDVRAQLAEQRAHDPFSLFEHRAQQVLRLDLLVLIAFSEFDSGLNRLLAAECEFV